MENNSEKKKYLKTLIGDNIYFSPISLDDIEEYTEMINDIKVSVGLGSVSYTNITDFESEKEFLTSIKKGKMFAVRLLENDELLGNIGFNSLDMVNRNGALGVLIGNPKHQRKGYGTEALSLLLKYAFEILGLHKVNLSYVIYNKR